MPVATLQFTVPGECDGIRVKSFLRGRCRVSYRLMVQLKRVPRGITADGEHVRVIDRLRAGQQVVLTLPEDMHPMQPAEDGGVTVAYEDGHVLVLDKPAGMTVHPTRGHLDGTLANFTARYLAQKGESGTFRPINRLDRDTTGLVAAAKNAYAASRLNHVNGLIDKEYLAVAEGMLEEGGVIDKPIRHKEGHGIMREVGEGGERAVTHYEVLARGRTLTLLRIRLETGRTHQIRVHFSDMGYPLAGDTMYGQAHPVIGRQALHCFHLWFTHPVSGERVETWSQLPQDMQELLRWDGMETPQQCFTTIGGER